MAAPSVDSVEAATEILRNLTGRRWTWPPLRITEAHRLPNNGNPRPALLLATRPVLQVESVVDHQTGYPVVTELSDGFRLTVTHQGCCSSLPIDLPAWWDYALNYPSGYTQCPRELRVQYVAGSRPSGNLQRAILQLAEQFDAATDPEAECRLPERVTSINRQGTSWTMIDPMDFLVKGRTGLYFVDLVIASISGGGRVGARARAWSPEHPPPRRLSAVRVDPATLTSN